MEFWENEKRDVSRAKAVKNVEAMMNQRGGHKIAAEVWAEREGNIYILY